MMMSQILSLKMLKTLQQGKKRFSNEALQRTASFVESQLTGNGAFMDKNRKRGLYYTAFGWMLAYVLKLKIDTSKTEKWLETQNDKLSDLLYYSAFVRCQMLCKLLKFGKLNLALSRLFQAKSRLPGFTNYPHKDIFSPYSQFLLVSLKEDLGITINNRQEIVASLSSYRIENRGFSNIKTGTQTTTNATVAALAVKGQLSGYQNSKDVDFLRSLQDDSGGFYANHSAPVPDLLSTATALFMLKCYGVQPRFNADDFIDAHWQSSGGFCATLVDESCDVEYVFYGLLGLGCGRF
jgi:hypothetical protein